MAGCCDVVGKDGSHQHLDVGNSVQCVNVFNVLNETTYVEEVKRRLKTYTQALSQWTSKKSSRQLATAGFIYTGVADKVECQSCGIRLYNWQEDEEPLQAHKKYAPDCEFMMTNFPEIKTPPQPKKIPTVKYKHYADYEARLRSFDSWPLKCVAQRPEIMARSGFFYIGSADRARCFHCGVTLRDWDTDDYPPCAHCDWSKHCPFVQQLDIDSMKAEIEEWEREEKLRIEFEHSTVQTSENEQSTFYDVSGIQGKDEPGESMVVEENGNHVLNDQVLCVHVLDERGCCAWERSNSDTLDADVQAACEIFLNGNCYGSTPE